MNLLGFFVFWSGFLGIVRESLFSSAVRTSSESTRAYWAVVRISLWPAACWARIRLPHSIARRQYAGILVAGFDVPMIICLFMYAYRDGQWEQYDYWYALTAIAWLQLAVLAVWGGSHLAMAYFDFRPGSRHTLNHDGRSDGK